MEPVAGPCREGNDRAARSGKAKMVEAGGVEPPSVKPHRPKPTCLSGSIVFIGGAQNRQDTPPTSPADFAVVPGTTAQQLARGSTPHSGPAGGVRRDGSLRLSGQSQLRVGSFWFPPVCGQTAPGMPSDSSSLPSNPFRPLANSIALPPNPVNPYPGRRGP